MTRSSLAVSAAGVPEVRPLRNWGRWVGAVVVLLLAVWAASSFATNPRLDWEVVGTYFFHPSIMQGLVRTIVLTLVAMGVGSLLGVGIALMRLSANPVLNAISWFYVWIFRSTPTLVQLLFWYNLAALYPRLGIYIPFGPEIIGGDTNTLVTVYVAAVLAFGLNESAYMAEIIRSGIMSVGPGQVAAAQSIGLTPTKTLRRVILPQALRVIIPPAGNETISVLKFTALASVIALPDLLYSAQLIYARNFQTIPLLVVATAWYLILTSVLGIGQRYLERHYGRGYQ